MAQRDPSPRACPAPGRQGERVVRQAECKFEGDAAQVRAARRFVTGFLSGDWPDGDAAVLLASELAANAVLHSLSGRPGGKFTVRAAMKPGEYLWVEVEDEGGTWVTRDADGERGRGLDIVAAVADEWGRDGDPVTGWVVWARLRASRSIIGHGTGPNRKQAS
jgi:serine/threonine-protein kinase RsbW